MKRFRVPFARAQEVTHEHPERTARRNAGTGMNFDVEFQVWPSRAAMLTTISMQLKGTPVNPWRPLPVERTCTCGKTFIVREFDTEYCSDTCWRNAGVQGGQS